MSLLCRHHSELQQFIGNLKQTAHTTKCKTCTTSYNI